MLDTKMDKISWLVVFHLFNYFNISYLIMNLLETIKQSHYIYLYYVKDSF